MAKYIGSVSLVNISDVAATAVVGISHSKILYIISGTGNVPPDLEDVPLVSTSGDVLIFADLGTSFLIEDEVYTHIRMIPKLN